LQRNDLGNPHTGGVQHIEQSGIAQIFGGMFLFGAASNLSTSSAVKVLGSLFLTFGESILVVGFAAIESFFFR
jgi:hypothetical protein